MGVVTQIIGEDVRSSYRTGVVAMHQEDRPPARLPKAASITRFSWCLGVSKELAQAIKSSRVNESEFLVRES